MQLPYSFDLDVKKKIEKDKNFFHFADQIALNSRELFELIDFFCIVPSQIHCSC